MHVSQAALLSIVLPLALVTVPGATTGGAPKSKENARVVAPQEVLDLGRFKRRFDQEDIPLVTRALHNQGIDNFLCTIDPQTGDVDVSTDEKHIPHFDLKPGSCPNPIQIRGGGAAATLPGGVLGNGFDVTQVDLGSVRLQRPPPGAFLFDAQVVPIHLTFVDVGTPFDPKSPCECAALGPDGILDINVLFDKSDAITILKLDHEADGSSIPLQIVGLGIGSNSIFAATDCARIQLH
jgi:hypothetical protein